MKTRKVGKIVSLLVAIVLVATIMIPAASVLADSTKYADVKWTEVGSFTELQQAIENANDANLEAGKTAYIRLTADILCKRPYFASDEENGGNTNWAKMYLYSVTRIYQNRKIQEKKATYWSDLDLGDKGLPWPQNHYQNQYDVTWLLAQTGSPFDVKDVNSVFYGMTVDDFNNGFVVDTNNQDYVGMGKKAPQKGCQGVEASYDEKIGNEYAERELVIEAGANVTIDLNGKTLKGSDYDPYSSTPNYQMSVLKVDAGGNLTVVDLAGNGQISGGTGNVYFDESVAEDNSAVARAAIFNEDWTVRDASGWGTWTHKSGKYRVWYRSHSVWAENAKESRGGGVYVCDGGTFTLESGKIARNCAWMSTNGAIFDTNKNMEAKGGGIYVEAGGTVNMYGGEICNNAARAYNKKSDVNDAHAYGGAIYLEAAANGKVATFNMTGGKIAENAAYAETLSSDNSKSARSYGAGIYVGTGSVCNIMGSAKAEGPTTEAMLASFPQITNNSCGALIRKTSQTRPEIVVQGVGIYCDGTLNMKKALVSSNDFSEFSINLANNDVSTVGKDVVHVDRDAETSLPLYIYDYNDDGTAKTKVTRLDDRFTENLELSTEKVAHETSGIFGVARGNENINLTSDGAGVYLGTNARMNVGERTWITGNYDLVTTGHKAFDETRNYAMHWDKTANGGAGGYVYTAFAEGAGNGYTWSDTSDDVYLPEGVTMYKGDSLFESRIGVNYYDMVDKEGDVSVGATGRASNRVIVKSATDLDYNLWGATSSTPMQTDIQFFTLNDNNKNYERDNYADLPTRQTVTLDTVTCELLDLTLTPEGKLPSWAQRTLYRVAVIDTDKFNDEQGQYRKKYLSPYQGYVDFDTVYPAGRFFYTTEVRYNTNSNPYIAYNKETYFKADPEKNPTTAAMANKNVVFPQRAYQIDATASQLSESEQRAKFMDYKVIYDDNGFGSDAAPVLRFGKGDRQMYVTYNFDEADKTYYGKNVNDQSLNAAINIDNLITSKSIFKIINTAEDGSAFTFYGANRPTGTLMFNKIVPDYKAYKASSVLADRTANRKSELTSITKTNGNEDKDLYFKGWSFYTSYGYGPEIVTLNNKDALQSINVDATKASGISLDYRGTFTADLSKIINQNVNAQPCPSMTATWYTKEELAEARKKVSNVMFQTVQRQNDDGTTTNLLRAVALAGSQYLDFDEVGFVISTTNATPTIEGGYDYVVKSKVYEKLGVNATVGAEKTYYDVDKLLGGTWSGQTSVKIEDKAWTFTEGSEFAANVTTGATGKKGYKDAGLFYTNIVITDANKDTVYFVTPYAKMGNTYFYGESRAACYTDAPTA